MLSASLANCCEVKLSGCCITRRDIRFGTLISQLRCGSEDDADRMLVFHLDLCQGVLHFGALAIIQDGIDPVLHRNLS